MKCNSCEQKVSVPWWVVLVIIPVISSYRHTPDIIVNSIGREFYFFGMLFIVTVFYAVKVPLVKR